MKDDIKVLRNIWFKKLADGDHAKRLEEFYAPQAEACEGALRSVPPAVLL